MQYDNEEHHNHLVPVAYRVKDFQSRNQSIYDPQTQLVQNALQNAFGLNSCEVCGLVSIFIWMIIFWTLMFY